jgi:site-specific recombinase XerD
MRSTFKILFYIKKNAVKSNGKAPVMARITLNGEIAQFSLKCEINPSDWNPGTGRAVGKSAAAQKLNGLLDNFRASLTQHYREISDREATVTAEKVRNAFLGLQMRNDSLLDLFDEHCKNLEIQIGRGVSRDTHQKYLRTGSRLRDFMNYKYHISDINLKEINHSFLCDFEIYLKTIHSCGQNMTAKFMQRVRTIILIAKSNGWIHADPSANYKLQTEKTEREFLNERELESIIQKKFTVKRLEQVRDIFVFSCFTGLAYIDVFNLRDSNIRTAFDNALWIMGKRVKTNVSYRVPLLDIPKMIIEKYKGSLPGGELLPVITNQKMNAYLKEIADLCGIDKNLSFHVARHTFATTVTLSKGVSIESVSKMLGHTSIKTTRIYARITDDKIKNDMAMLAGKLNEMKTKYAENP